MLGDLDKKQYIISLKNNFSTLYVHISKHFVKKGKVNRRFEFGYNEDGVPFEGLFLFCENKFISPCDSMNEIYNKFHDKEDGILYIYYSSQEIFG